MAAAAAAAAAVPSAGFGLQSMPGLPWYHSVSLSS